MDPVASSRVSADRPTIPRTARSAPVSIAHRGFAGAYPENTRAAMRAATAASTGRSIPADAVEIDVVPCGTGELVVFHDAFLDRLTDAAGAAGALCGRPVWETPFERLREVEVLGTGETVPLLSELLETIPENVGVNVELKNPGTVPARTYRDLPEAKRASHDRAWESVAARFIDVIEGFNHDLFVTSSYEGALRATQEYAPELALSYFFWDSVDAGLEITRRYDCEVLCPPRTAISGTSFFNAAYGDLPAGGFCERDLVSLAHAEDRAVCAWTIETPRQASELRAAGVDGLLCEYPGLLGPERVTPSVAGPAND